MRGGRDIVWDCDACRVKVPLTFEYAAKLLPTRGVYMDQLNGETPYLRQARLQIPPRTNAPSGVVLPHVR
jgi:hypothetical protein